MDEKQSSLSDEVIIEIVHSIKDIVIELIDKAFPKKENKKEERMKRSEIAEFIESMEKIGDSWTEEQVEDVYGDMSLKEALADMKRFVKCFFELLTQIIVKVRKCKAQRVCVLHFQLAGSGGCFFLMKLYH